MSKKKRQHKYGTYQQNYIQLYEVWMNVTQHRYEMLEENLNTISSMILFI